MGSLRGFITITSQSGLQIIHQEEKDIGTLY